MVYENCRGFFHGLIQLIDKTWSLFVLNNLGQDSCSFPWVDSVLSFLLLLSTTFLKKNAGPLQRSWGSLLPRRGMGWVTNGLVFFVCPTSLPRLTLKHRNFFLFFYHDISECWHELGLYIFWLCRNCALNSRFTITLLPLHLGKYKAAWLTEGCAHIFGKVFAVIVKHLVFVFEASLSRAVYTHTYTHMS